MDIGYLAYPRHTPLDLIGPCEVLGRLPGARTHLVWTRPGPVQADRGVGVGATTSFADAPRLDVFAVPGGSGQAALMKHDGKFATAAGASAGLDLALELARRIGGEDVAQAIQLQIEYDPQPPLRAGWPRADAGEPLESLKQRARAYG